MRSEVWAGRREGVGRRQRTRGMHEERAQLWRHPVLDTPAEFLVACREQATFRALSSNADYSSVFGVWRGSRVRLPTNVT